MTTNSLNINDDGLPIFDSSTGQFDSVSLTTKGDILTHTGAIYSRLAVGADGDALTPDSGETTGLNYAPKQSGSAVVFLASQTASASSTVDFTSGFDDSTYAYYYFTLTNIRPTTNGVNFWMRVSVNGGSTYLTTDYRWAWYTVRSSSGGNTIGGSDSDVKIEVFEEIGNAAGHGLAGRIMWIPSSNPGPTRPGTFMTDAAYKDTTSTRLFRGIGTGANATSSTINAVRFLMSSGTIATGTIKLYGISNS